MCSFCCLEYVKAKFDLTPGILHISVVTVARAAVILAYRAPKLDTGVLYTLSLQKTGGVMSGERGGHFLGPFLLILWFWEGCIQKETNDQTPVWRRPILLKQYPWLKFF